MNAFGASTAVRPAELNAADLDEHDLIHGIVLPNLPDQLSDGEEMKREFDVSQARALDFTSLPVRMNHREHLGSVGVTIAYRLREGDGKVMPRAETLHKLHREPDVPPNGEDPTSDLLLLQRNLLMSGEHRGLSLGHSFHTDYVSDIGQYEASATGRPGRVIHKRPIEISTCRRGKRPGSEILEFMPCLRSLRRSTDDAIRSFCNEYRYTPPPPDYNNAHPGWPGYIEHLWSEARERRQKVLSEPGYASTLKARGIVNASLDDAFLEMFATNPQPWTVIAERLVQRYSSSPHFRTNNSPTMSSATNQAPPPQQQQPKPNENGAPTPSQTPAAQTPAPVPEATNVLPNQANNSNKPLDVNAMAMDQAAENFAAAKALAEQNEKLLKELGEYKQREAAEQNSRKRKQEDDQAAEVKQFEEMKKNTRGAFNAMAEKMYAERQLSPQLVNTAITNAIDDVEAAKTADELRTAIKRHTPILELNVQASNSALNARQQQQQQELLEMKRKVQSWMQQPVAAGGIQSSGGWAPQQQQQSSSSSSSQFQTNDSGVHNASMRSATNVLADAYPKKEAAPAPSVNLAAENKFEQIFDAHVASTGTIPSRQQLLHGGVRIQTIVQMSATGPVEQKVAQPLLQEPLPLREYNMKTAAPEYFKPFLAGVRAALNGTGARPEPAMMDTMHKLGKTPMIPFGGPMPHDGWQTVRMY